MSSTRSKRALTNIMSSLLLQIITVVCGFIIPRLIIKNYGSNVNGLLTSITQFLSYIVLLESGFGPVLKSVLYKPIASKNKEEIEAILKSAEKFFKTIAYIFIIYIIVLCTVLPQILSKEFDKVFVVSLIVIISVSTFAEYFFGITYKLYLQAEQKTYVTSFFQIVATVINTVAIILAICLGASVQIVKIISVIIFVIKPIAQNVYVKKKYKINLTKANKNYEIKQKWNGLAQHIAATIHSNSDIVILTLFSGTIEVSVYSVYMLVVTGIKNFMKSFIGGIDSLFGDMIAKEELLNLNKSFEKYEFLYQFLATAVFSSTLLLITPFVMVYTNGITDANYNRPVFAIIMVIAEYIWVVRQPYNELVKAAGHFKQTQIGSWIEAISNVVISVILVWNYGIVGVAIGTLISIGIRAVELMYYASKYILKRNIVYTIKRILVSILAFGIVVAICKFLPNNQINGYKDWLINACCITLISFIVVFFINLFFYKKNIIEIIPWIVKSEENKKS